MEYRVDEIDKRILHYLGADARNTTAPAIADDVDVTPATIRNRIRQLEEQGVLKGYHADVDYERIEGRTKYLFTCTVPVTERDRLAQEALDVPGVINVRELMAGRRNLRVVAVAVDTGDLSRIAGELADLGLDIEDEDVVEHEHFHPYHQFGPEDEPTGPSLTNFVSLAGDAEVVELTVSEGATVEGVTIEEAVDAGVLVDDQLVVGIERGGTVVTPKGDTELLAGDVVTLFSRDVIDKETLNAFGGPRE